MARHSASKSPEGQASQRSDAGKRDGSFEPKSPTNNGEKINKPGREDAGSVTVNKRRRRVSRACDECRRKKIKCNGRQPCENCSVYHDASDCTYDKPSNRFRSAPLQALRNVERRLQRAEALIHRLVPHCDLQKAGLGGLELAHLSVFLASDSDVPYRHGESPVAGVGLTRRISDNSEDLEDDGYEDGDDYENEEDGDCVDDLVTLSEKVGRVDLNEHGEWDFHGLSSDAAYFGRMTKSFPELTGYDARTPFLPQASWPLVSMPYCQTQGRMSDRFGLGGLLPTAYGLEELPARALARTLCEYSLQCATCLLQTVHVPSFYRMFDSIYDTPAPLYSSEQRRFLGLLYAVLALGSMYDVDEHDPSNPDHYAVAMNLGFRYYLSARLSLQGLTECRDMTTLQALVFMAQFLQATANLSECHSFVGIALRSAFRMGLHRHLPHVRMTPIEDQHRRRLFHVIWQMDIYLSTAIGLPLVLREQDIDQPLPAEVGDEFITETAILEPPPGTYNLAQAFNAHAKLMRILAKVVQTLYPPSGVLGDAVFICARVKDIEKDLHSWFEQLPTVWRPGPPADDVQVTRLRALLRFAYAHVQMMLYRPFLHAPLHGTGHAGLTADKLLQPCRAAGVQVCRNILRIGFEIRKQGVLIGPYWFIMHTQFLAVLSLVFHVLNNKDEPASAEILAEAHQGKDNICGLSKRSLVAHRVATALQALFEKLPDRLGEVRGAIPSTYTAAQVQVDGGQGQNTSQLGSFPQMGSGPAFPEAAPGWNYVQAGASTNNPVIVFPVTDPLGYPEMDWLGGSATAGQQAQAWTGVPGAP
ncbi:fungal-specific transcription factor domain-containing protein [Podospora aff. communis PSN243]|uniref:Fungal-specific transcription factor domain-containing protein n=1 Tax=Podospora aff. communis PSN243 TaxID=3040156 RepID=A0AAV9GPT3_9PEZI|nr:fungal-specific transcription factor domain-containing protein [Podospora aff. communis PSN243]